MIFYKNKKKNKTVQEKNLVFSIFQNGVETDKDDSILNANVCKNTYNVSFSDGALKTGLGFEDFKVPASATDLETCHGFDFAERADEITRLWLDRWYNNEDKTYYYQLTMTDSQDMLYGVAVPDEFEGFVLVRTSLMQNKNIKFGMNYRLENIDSFAFFTEQGMAYLTYKGQRFYENVPPIISCVVHYGNFFGITNTDRNLLVYTKNLDLREWNNEQSSTIEFLDNRGAFTKLISFNDYVYLFREYGITKISLYSSKENFSFTHLYTSTSKIYENSVCVCDDVVMFVTRDGLYKFNGNSVTKVFDELDGYIKNFDNRNCSSACLNGKYYLATACDFQDGQEVGCEAVEHKNNVLFEFDLRKNTIDILRGVDIRQLLAFDTPVVSKLCACFYGANKQRVGQLNYSGKIFESIPLKIWESASTDLGHPGKRKHLKEVFLISEFNCEIEIVSDEEKKTFKVFADKNEQRIQISVYGKHFKFVFKTTNEKIKIKKPVVVFDVLQ